MKNFPEEAPLSPEEKNIKDTLKKINLEGGPFTGVFKTYRGDIDIKKSLLETSKKIMEYTQTPNFLTYVESTGSVPPDTEEHLKKFLIPIDDLYYLVRTYAVLNTASYLSKNNSSWKKKSSPKDIDNLVTEALNTMAYSVIDPFNHTLAPKIIKSPGFVDFMNTAITPLMMQFCHNFVLEWMSQGGDLMKAGQKATSLKMFYLRPPHPSEANSAPEYALTTSIAREYSGMHHNITFVQKILNTVVSESDREAEKTELETFKDTYKNSQPYNGWLDQQVALRKLDQAKELDRKFNEYLSMVIDAGNAGKVLPDVVFQNQDGQHSCTIELNLSIGRYTRENQVQQTVLPILYIYTKDQKKKDEKIHTTEQLSTALTIDPTLFAIQATGRYGALPVEMMRQHMGLEKMDMRKSPQVTFFDVARHYEGGLAWANRVLIPAIEKLAEMYLDAEEFEQSERFITGITEIAKNTYTTPEDTPTDTVKVPFTPFIQDKATEEEAQNIPSLFYSSVTQGIYYLRTTPKEIAANDRNRELYKTLTGRTLPKNTVLREVPYQRSAITWREVESVLKRHFGIEKDRQKGSHMQYYREVTTSQGVEEVRGTILAHYEQTAKPKTLQSVLTSLHIPEALFWIIVSKKYKTMNIDKNELLSLSESTASKIKKTTQMKD